MGDLHGQYHDLLTMWVQLPRSCSTAEPSRAACCLVACWACARGAARLAGAEGGRTAAGFPVCAGCCRAGLIRVLLPANHCSFGLVGYPSPSKCFVFNGDFVDRGAWGLEILLLLAALKVAAPACVALVRGNHESLYCRWESQVAGNRWLVPED